MKRIIASLTLTFFLFCQDAPLGATQYSPQKAHLRARAVGDVAGDGASKSTLRSLKEELGSLGMTAPDGGVRLVDPLRVKNILDHTQFDFAVRSLEALLDDRLAGGANTPSLSTFRTRFTKFIYFRESVLKALTDSELTIESTVSKEYSGRVPLDIETDLSMIKEGIRKAKSYISRAADEEGVRYALEKSDLMRALRILQRNLRISAATVGTARQELVAGYILDGKDFGEAVFKIRSLKYWKTDWESIPVPVQGFFIIQAGQRANLTSIPFKNFKHAVTQILDENYKKIKSTIETAYEEFGEEVPEKVKNWLMALDREISRTKNYLSSASNMESVHGFLDLYLQEGSMSLLGIVDYFVDGMLQLAYQSSWEFQRGQLYGIWAKDGGVKNALADYTVDEINDLLGELKGFQQDIPESISDSEQVGTIAVYESALDNASVAKAIEVFGKILDQDGVMIGFTLISTSGDSEEDIVKGVLKDSNGAINLNGAFQDYVNAVSPVHGKLKNPALIHSELTSDRKLPLRGLIAPEAVVKSYQSNKVPLYAYLIPKNAEEGEEGIADGSLAVLEMIKVFVRPEMERVNLLYEGALEFTVEIVDVSGELKAVDRLYQMNRGV